MENVFIINKAGIVLYSHRYFDIRYGNVRMHVLRAVLKHVSSWNTFQIGIVFRSEKCETLNHVSDWHYADIIISKQYVKCEVLEQKNLCKEPKSKAKLVHCFLFSVMNVVLPGNTRLALFYSLIIHCISFVYSSLPRPLFLILWLETVI